MGNLYTVFDSDADIPDSYYVSGSLWVSSNDGVLGVLLDSLGISTDAYNFEYDNKVCQLYWNGSRKLTLEVNQPDQWVEGPTHDTSGAQYNVLSTRQSIIDAYEANGPQYHLTLPLLGGDVGITSGTLSQVSALVMRLDDGAGHIHDMDFSGTVKGFPQSWPPPDGASSDIPLTEIASYSNVFKTVNVIYEGDYVDAKSVSRRHFYNTTTTALKSGAGWNHVAFAIDNDALTHNWVINGVNVTDTFVNFDDTDPLSPPVVPTSSWKIQFNGLTMLTFQGSALHTTQFAMPSFRPNATGSGLPQTAVMQFAHYQIWANQYIDWTNSSNYSKVVKITGSTGTPASATAAAAAFGAPAIWFKGKASDRTFFTNRGTGGAFVKSGTITDYTPGPSY